MAATLRRSMDFPPVAATDMFFTSSSVVVFVCGICTCNW
jgi:hypothetical protein